MWFVLPIALLLILGAGSAAGRAKVRSRPAPELARRLAAKWGKVFGVPAAFVLTIMERESGFDPASVNMNERALPKGGAWGLMQITWDTANDDLPRLKKTHGGRPEVKETLARWTGMPSGLQDPELNTMLGVFHMKKLVDEFKTMENVAAAYHQGGATVRELLRRDGDLRNLKPFGRQYVTRAMEIYRRYA